MVSRGHLVLVATRGLRVNRGSAVSKGNEGRRAIRERLGPVQSATVGPRVPADPLERPARLVNLDNPANPVHLGPKLVSLGSAWS